MTEYGKSARLADKVVLITGSTKGLGLDMAFACAAAGARVVITGRSEEAGEQAANQINATGGESIFVRCDVNSEDDVEAAVGAGIDRWGRLDGVVANASNYVGNNGQGYDNVVTEMTLEGWNAILSSDLTGVFLTLKHGIRALCAGSGGSVVTMASQHALRGVNGSAGYSAAKGGVVSLTRAVASYYARYDVRANSIAPGLVYSGSEYLQDLLEDPVKGPYLWDLYLGRIGEPSDVSNAVLYLLSDESAFVNGVVLPVDGGAVSAAHMRRPHIPDLPQYTRKRDRAPLY
jgi:NAD(P)-dependent dehydrogenase (short-subunit alcohol dehydrogenase family)